jgi:hypothetical protein
LPKAPAIESTKNYLSKSCSTALAPKMIVELAFYATDSSTRNDKLGQKQLILMKGNSFQQ